MLFGVYACACISLAARKDALDPCVNVGVSTNGATPIAGWFLLEEIPFNWMMTGGSPIYGNPHVEDPNQ